MIEVESLTKRYGRATAVDGFLPLEEGQILGFLGPTGPGRRDLRHPHLLLPPRGYGAGGRHDVFAQPWRSRSGSATAPRPALYRT